MRKEIINMDKMNWIIGICNTAADGVVLRRAYGTKEQIKELLVKYVNEDRIEDEDCWDYGCESVEEIEETSNGELSAYATYCNYHIDYTAVPENNLEIEEL